MSSVLDVLHVFPAIVLHAIQSHRLPVHGQGLSIFDATKGWHLEGEQGECATHAQVLLLVHFLWLASLHVILDGEVVIQEFTIESTDNHNLIVSDLAHSSTLASGDLSRDLDLVQVNSLPVLVLQIIQIELETLYRGRVLFVRVLDTTEDVNEFVIEMSTRVVVSTLIDSWKFEPFINIHIIELYSIGSILDLLP